MSQDISQSVIDAVKDSLKTDDVDNDSAIGKPRQWDSLRHLRVLIAIERKFNVKIEPALVAELISVTRITRFLREELRLTK